MPSPAIDRSELSPIVERQLGDYCKNKVLKFPRLSGQGVKQVSIVHNYLDCDIPSMSVIGIGCKT